MPCGSTFDSTFVIEISRTYWLKEGLLSLTNRSDYGAISLDRYTRLDYVNDIKDMMTLSSPMRSENKVNKPPSLVSRARSLSTFAVKVKNRTSIPRGNQMPALPHLSRHVNPSEIWSNIDEHGGVIIDDFIDPSLLQRLRDDVLPAVSDFQPGASTGQDFWKDFHGAATKRITGLAELSLAWGDLLCDPLYKGMADHYLGEDDYYLNTGQLICIGPGETPQILHRDELNWPDAIGPGHEITLTAIFALTDFTEENGATVVVPGSHRWPGANPEVQPDQTCRAVMKAGSAILYSGKIMHGGGANVSKDQWRVGLHAGFISGWLRAEENHQLTTSLEVARKLPEHAQKMLGFRSYVPAKSGRLGLVNFDDASVLLEANSMGAQQ